MKTNSEFDLKKFQSEVFDELTNMKAVFGLSQFHLKGFGSSEKFKKRIGDPDAKYGLVIKAILRFFSFLGKKANTNILNKPEFVEMERKAAEIADNPKIKRILCQALKKEIRSDLFKEAVHVKLVKVLTVSLTQEEIIEEFFIEKDVRLFSLIALRILRTRISHYCP